MTSQSESDPVFDTGPLSHLAEAGWLSILRSVAGVRTVVITDAVVAELRQGLHANPHLQQVLDSGWIVRHGATAVIDDGAVDATLSAASWAAVPVNPCRDPM